MWQISSEEFKNIVASCSTLSEILKHFNLMNKGGNHNTLKRRMIAEGIDFSHIKTGIGSNKGRKFDIPSQPLSEILVEHSTYNRSHLKNRLVKEGLLKNECSICGLGSEWQGKKIVHILDHVNGICDDNRIENLRMVCPNCNSQLDTFSGKNARTRKKRSCKGCGGPVSSGTKNGMCSICYGKSRRKVSRPDISEIKQSVESVGYVKTGKKYGVSDNAIRKWINTP